MDTGKVNNTFFYDGYEGEGEIILSLDNHMSIHVWDGFFDDIFCNPVDSIEWKGFTKDYQESTRTYDGKEYIFRSEIPEYLSDLRNYSNRTFSYPETYDCLKILIEFFEHAINSSSEITVQIC